MDLKLIPLAVALSLPLAAFGSACADDDDDDSMGGRAGRGGSGGSAGGSGASGAGAGGAGTGGQSDGGTQNDARAEAGAPDSRMNFFVSSQGSTTGNLGGLAGADTRCQTLASAVGMGSKTWRAYLSVEGEFNDGGAVHARDRIGDGPWYNFRGTLLANDLAALHARVGDAELFLDEQGHKVPGQWPGSPRPIEHDILTGTNADGGVAPGMTCSGWTSDTADAGAQVGHSDGLGPDAVFVVVLVASERRLQRHRATRRSRAHLLFRHGLKKRPRSLQFSNRGLLSRRHLTRPAPCRGALPEAVL